jgi:hypothetical protein
MVNSFSHPSPRITTSPTSAPSVRTSAGD